MGLINLNFISNLYFGETVNLTGRDFILTLKKLKNCESIKNLYLICVCDGNNLFEIICSSQISKEYVKRKKYTVIGLANGRDEAFYLVTEIIRSYITNFPDCNFSILKQRIV